MYLNVGSNSGVHPVRPEHVGQRGGARKAGGHSMAHIWHRKHLEAKLLIQLLQIFIWLLFTLTQDAAHHIAALLWWPLSVQRERKSEYTAYDACSTPFQAL